MPKRQGTALARGIGAVAALLAMQLAALSPLAHAGDTSMAPQLTVSQTASSSRVNLAETVSYTVTVENWSIRDAVGVVVTVELFHGRPATVLQAMYTAPRAAGQCVTQADSLPVRVVCSLPDRLTELESATVWIFVEPNSVGDLTSVATASAHPNYTSADRPSQVTSVVNGLGCTIIGTSAADSITGTANRDVICALGGDDTVSSAGRNDVIYGSSGNDTLSGARGDDTLDGGLGNDVLGGGRGGDFLRGGPGSDILRGHAGPDTLDGVDGFSGNDTVNGGPGSDTCNADPGDTITNCP